MTALDGRPTVGRLSFRVIVKDLTVRAITAALNVLIVYWLGQLAFPSLGLVPPTILGAVGITGLAWVLRRPVSLRESGDG